MGGGWRGKHGEVHQQEQMVVRLQSRKPHLDKCHSLPSWEKKFCYSVGLISWKWLVDAKKYMHLHDNVMKWDDSACEEAFNNAKNRFWMEINGLPSDISLPDPDIYIDDVDWDSCIDPDLLLDLDSESKAPASGEEHQGGVIIGLPLAYDQNQTMWTTGWGEAEQDYPKSNALFRTDCNNTGWGEAEQDYPKSNALFRTDCNNTGWGEAEQDYPKSNALFRTDCNNTGWGEAEQDYPKSNALFRTDCNNTGWGEAEQDYPRSNALFRTDCNNTGWGNGEEDYPKSNALFRTGCNYTGWGEAEQDYQKSNALYGTDCNNIGWGDAEQDYPKSNALFGADCNNTGWGETEKDYPKSNALFRTDCYNTGWGEAEENYPKTNALFRTDGNNCYENVNDGKNSWEMNHAFNSSAGWNDWDNNHNKSDNRFTNEFPGTWDAANMNGVSGTWDANSRKTGGSWYHSTYNTPRSHGNGYRKASGWRNGRGRKRVNFAHQTHGSENWNYWNSNGAVPVSHYTSGKRMNRV